MGGEMQRKGDTWSCQKRAKAVALEAPSSEVALRLQTHARSCSVHGPGKHARRECWAFARVICTGAFGESTCLMQELPIQDRAHVFQCPLSSSHVSASSVCNTQETLAVPRLNHYNAARRQIYYYPDALSLHIPSCPETQSHSLRQTTSTKSK